MGSILAGCRHVYEATRERCAGRTITEEYHRWAEAEGGIDWRTEEYIFQLGADDRGFYCGEHAQWGCANAHWGGLVLNVYIKNKLGEVFSVVGGIKRGAKAPPRAAPPPRAATPPPTPPSRRGRWSC